tara:strand:+ start:4621 stop:4857 length:237 start_codon:yes stop_codon:yes gene_type:complete
MRQLIFALFLIPSVALAAGPDYPEKWEDKVRQNEIRQLKRDQQNQIDQQQRQYQELKYENARIRRNMNNRYSDPLPIK